MTPETDYNVTESIEYVIACENCDTSTGHDGNEDRIRTHAKNMGFTAVHTPDDGTINLCPECIGAVKEPNQ